MCMLNGLVSQAFCYSSLWMAACVCVCPCARACMCVLRGTPFQLTTAQWL